MGFILHCGGKTVSYDEACRVPLPQETRSYKPVGHGTIIDMVEEGIDRFLPQTRIADRQFGLAREGAHFFGHWTLETKNSVARYDAEGKDALSLSVGARNSLDKSMPAAVCGGGKVLVCDNLCFSGDDFHVARKHTTYIMRDLQGLIARALQASPHAFKAMQELRLAMKDIALPTDEGYKLLGLMQGRGILRSQQANVAYREWGFKPSHEEFAPRNAWSFYNCLTEAAKKGQATDVITRHAKLTAFCQRELLPA